MLMYNYAIFVVGLSGIQWVVLDVGIVVSAIVHEKKQKSGINSSK